MGLYPALSLQSCRLFDACLGSAENEQPASPKLSENRQADSESYRCYQGYLF